MPVMRFIGIAKECNLFMSKVFVCNFPTFGLGAESALVETTDVGKKITEKEQKVATEELSSEAPAAPLQSTGKHRAHCRRICLRVHTKLHFIICKSVFCN